MSSQISLLVVDAHVLFRRLLALALEDCGFTISGQADDAASCFARVESCSPDVVLLDLRLRGLDGLTIIRHLLKRAALPKILITGCARQQDIDDAWVAGVHGCAGKTSDLVSLSDGIRAVFAGKRWRGPGLPVPRPERRSRRSLGGGPLATLSPRERVVFRLVVRGMTPRQIAVALAIEPKTVGTHRERILKKLAMHSVVDLVRLAAQHCLLE